MKNIKLKFASQALAIGYLHMRGWRFLRQSVAGIWMKHPEIHSHLNLIRKSRNAWVIEAL